MKCTREKPEACFNCPYPDCIDTGRKDRTEYFQAYYQNMSEEKKEKRRKRALRYYRKHRKQINAEKRRRRAEKC